MSPLSRFALLLSGVLLAGCNNSTTPEQFQTYDALLSQESSQETTPKADSSDAPEQADTGSSPLSPDPNQAVVMADGDAAKETDADLAYEIPASAIAPLNVVDGSSTAAILKVVDRQSPDAPVSAESVTTAGAAAPATPLAQPGGIKLLVPKQEFRVEGPDQALRVSYDDLDLLKILNMEPVPVDATNYFPEWLSNLNGKPVRIRGFMYPTFESSGIEQFVLARDNQICCFGRDPKVYDLIFVTMKPGKTTDYIPNRPFDVVGTLRIDLQTEGGKPLGLYLLEDARVIDR